MGRVWVGCGKRYCCGGTPRDAGGHRSLNKLLQLDVDVGWMCGGCGVDVDVGWM